MKKNKIGLYDITFFCCIMSTLAFHDRRIIFILSQVLFAIFSLFDIIRNKKIRLTRQAFKYVIWYLLFFLFCVSSSLWALNTITIRSILISIVQVSIVGLCIINYLKEEANIRKMMFAVMVAATFLCCRLIVNVPLSAWGTERVGVYIGYGTVSGSYVLAYASVIVFYLARKKKNKLYYALSLLIILMSCMTGAKKGIIAFALGVFIILFLESKNIKAIIQNATIFFIICIVGYLSIMNIKPLYNAIGARIEASIGQIKGDTLDKSTRDRSLLIEYAWGAFKKHPLLGIGIDGFRNYEENPIKAYAHNNYLELLADIGVIGTLLYYSIIFYTLTILLLYRKRLDSHCVLSIALLLTLLVGDLSSVSYCQDFLQIYLSTAFGIACFCQAKHNNLKIKKGDDLNAK